MIDLRGTVLGPVSARGFHALKRLGFLDQEYLQLLPGAVNSKRWGKWYLPANVLPAAAVPRLPRRALRSGITLRRYQARGSAFIEQAVQGCLINDDVGLGKTVQVLDFLDRHPELRPFVVTGVVAAQGSWVGRSADPFRHFGLRVELLGTRTPKAPAKGGADGYFLNFSVTPEWRDVVIRAIRPKVLVMDEVHELRNPRRADAKAVRKISHDCSEISLRVGLTATVLVNDLRDLWVPLDLVQPGMWGPWVTHPGYTSSFCARYNGAHVGEYGWVHEGPTNEEELRYRLRGVLLRRERSDVLDELPPFERQAQQIPTEALDSAAYQEYKMAEREMRGRSFSAQPLQRLVAMGSSLSRAKRGVAAREAAGLVRSTEGHKIVVFCWYKDTAAYITRFLTREGIRAYGPITGGVAFPKRLAAAEAFRDDLHPAAFVATLGAAGIALNPLSAASSALFVDLYWVPATLLQAEGRLHREGQRAAQVNFRYLLVQNSIDTIMFEHLQRKAKRIAVVGDRTARSLVEDLGGDTGSGMRALITALEALDEGALELQ